MFDFRLRSTSALSVFACLMLGGCSADPTATSAPVPGSGPNDAPPRSSPAVAPREPAVAEADASPLGASLAPPLAAGSQALASFVVPEPAPYRGCRTNGTDADGPTGEDPATSCRNYAVYVASTTGCAATGSFSEGRYASGVYAIAGLCTVVGRHGRDCSEPLEQVRESYCGCPLHSQQHEGQCLCLDDSYWDPHLSPSMSYPTGSCRLKGSDYRPKTNVAKVLGRECPSKGDPIHVATGNKYEFEVDLAARRPGGVELVRAYNSLLHKTGRSGSLGAGWVHSYDRRVVRSSTGALVRRPDGKTLQFAYEGGHFVAEPDVRDTLVERTAEDGSAGFRLALFEDDSVETFDAAGRLVEIRDRAGRTQSLSYRDGALARVEDSYGRVLTFEMQADHIVAVADSETGTVRFDYDASGRVVSVTRPGAGSRRYHYEGTSHLLTGITNQAGVRYVTWTYDTDGRALSNRGAGGDVSFVYEADGSVVVTEGAAPAVTYLFTVVHGVPRGAGASSGMCASGCNGPLGADIRYDARGFVVSAVDDRGVRTSYERDGRGRETRRVEGEGATSRTVLTEYHPTMNLVTKRVDPLLTTRSSYDGAGRLVERTEEPTAGGAPRTWRYGYDAAGNLVSEDGPRTDVNDVTRYTYDAVGNVTAVIDALGYATRYTGHTPEGRPTRIEAPTGLVTQLSYDAAGRVRTETRGPLTTTFEYSTAGKLVKKTLPDGRAVEYRYDADGKQIEGRLTATGLRTVFGYDMLGRLAKADLYSATGALLSSHSVERDEGGGVLRATGPGGTVETQLDSFGKIVATKDELGRVTTRTLDGLARVASFTDPVGGVTRFQYDLVDRLTGVTDPRGVVSAYERDAFGGVLREQSADAGKTERRRDEAGQVTWEKDATGVESSFAYDAIGRLTRRARTKTTRYRYTDGTTLEWSERRTDRFGYDEAPLSVGALTSIETRSGYEYRYGASHFAWDTPETVTRFAHDLLGQVVRRDETVRGRTRTVRYAYDAAGRLETLTYPSGTTIRHEYTGPLQTGLYVNGASLLSGITRSPLGEAASWTWGDGSTYARTFDGRGRLTSYPAGDRTRSLRYDDANRVVGVDDASDALRSTTYSYDALDRLVASQGGSTARSYAYDGSDNRTLATVDGAPTTAAYEASSNRRAPMSAVPVSYDAAGRVVRDGERNFTYGVDGRLASASFFRFRFSLTDGFSAESRYGGYTLNGLGERVGKTLFRYSYGAGKWSHQLDDVSFVYDEASRLLGEYPNYGYPTTTAKPQEFVYLEGKLVAVVRGAAVAYAHVDQLGTPRALVAPGGALVWRWDPDPFGAGAPEAVASFAGAGAMNLRFPGQYYDEESGLHYNLMRDYDPATGRYLEPDPIGLAGGLNRYAYVGADPVGSSDPNGLARIRINMMGTNDPARAVFEGVPQEDGTIDVIGHGVCDYTAPDGNYVMDGRVGVASSGQVVLGGPEVAAVVRSARGYRENGKCAKVRLIACDAGCFAAGNLLEQVAAALPEHEICAPIGLASAWPVRRVGTLGPPRSKLGPVLVDDHPNDPAPSSWRPFPGKRPVEGELGWRCIPASRPPCDCPSR